MSYTNINAVSMLEKFNIELAKVGQKYVKLHKPFDEPCARLEFRDRLEAAEKESERRNGFIKIEEIDVKIGDLDKYADVDRFELLEDQEDMADKVMEGQRTQIVIGHTLKYQCKKRGHGLSVFVPLADYNKKK